MSMGFPRQEYWRGLPFPFPEDLPDPGIKPESPELQVDSLPSEPPGKPLVVVQFKYGSLYVSIPNSLTIPFPFPSPSNNKFGKQQMDWSK